MFSCRIFPDQASCLKTREEEGGVNLVKVDTTIVFNRVVGPLFKDEQQSLSDDVDEIGSEPVVQRKFRHGKIVGDGLPETFREAGVPGVPFDQAPAMLFLRGGFDGDRAMPVIQHLCWGFVEGEFSTVVPTGQDDAVYLSGECVRS